MKCLDTLSQYALSKVQFSKDAPNRFLRALSNPYTSRKCVFIIVFSALRVSTVPGSRAQPVRRVSLSEAVGIALAGNNSIRKTRVEKAMAETVVDERKEQRLPEIDFHASYARITDLTEYRHGLGDKVVTNTIPVIADLTGSARMPLYTGGRIRNSIRKAVHEEQLAALKEEKVANDIRIQVTELFLRIYKMMELEKLLNEHIGEEQDRLREVKSFKAHGTATKNEVLRAELQLSDLELSVKTNRSNTDIAIRELKTLLELPEDELLELDTARMLTTPLPVGALQNYLNASLAREEMRMSGKMEDIAASDLAISRAGYYPQIHFLASFGFSYPNYMFFPPNPYLYTLGKIGVEATYSLSNLYKNKSKIHLARQRMEAQQLETGLARDRVRDNVFRQYSELQDTRGTIEVREKAVAQATENYRIVKVKYLHQLALITEMIDADNALLQARFEMLSARIDGLLKHRQLLYASGLLQ